MKMNILLLIYKKCLVYGNKYIIMQLNMDLIINLNLLL